ncbi:hypothetical protein HYH02_010746 [Chlamydomonas schloesseri]|uniref:Uncharacterized protein n=1 Tax=Chlamydomonas schloesseri TaxID=2026947 RepID=A0A835T553_9CHLO|nr:hypothetical protein HYH02_010746 [Chlamydomonas schloesseri]|eukprot:KAG2438953.1 hypothetical protein HYH02_010746 [Chlamydomonas schloesseri]
MRAKLLQPAAGIQSAQQPLAHPQQQMHAVLVPAYILPGAQLQQPLPMLPPSHTPLRQHAVHPVTHAQHPKQPCAPSGGGFDGRCHGGGYAGGCCGGGGVDDDNASSVSRKCSNGGGGLGGRDVISASSSAGRGSTALVAEYCRLVERLRAHLPLLRAQIAKYDKHAQRSSGEAGIKASRSRRILEEAHKRCTAEPGSAAAASYPITGAAWEAPHESQVGAQ